MGYNLWLASHCDIERYYYRRADNNRYGQMAIGDSKDVFPITLKIDGIHKLDFNLDEIDSLTCGYKDLDDLRKEFRKYPDFQYLADTPGTLIIASKSDNIGKYRVIYDSPLLKKCANVIRSKRNKELPLYLDRTDELREYVEKLAKYATDKKSGPSIRNFSILPPHVRSILDNYNESVTKKDEISANNHFENFFGYCMNYRTLRAFVIWEQDYLQKQKNERKERAAKNKEYREEKKAAYSEMKKADELKRRPYESTALETIDGMRDENGNIDFDQVYSQFDFDEIFSHSSDGLESIGIIFSNQTENSNDKKGPRKR